MGLLNRKKADELTAVEKCINLVDQKLVADDFDDITSQIKSVVEELEAIGQPIDPEEIVAEVLEQNDYEYTKSTVKNGQTKSLKVSSGARTVVLTNEPITTLNLSVKLGAAIIDLRNYDFTAGDLLIDLKANFSGVEIYVNSNVAIHDWIENKYSGISYNIDDIDYDNISNLQLPETEHTVTLEGKVRGSGITIRFDHEGPYVSQPGHHGTSFQANTDNKVDAKLNNELDKIDAKAQRKREKIKNRMERKRTKLNNDN